MRLIGVLIFFIVLYLGQARADYMVVEGNGRAAKWSDYSKIEKENIKFLIGKLKLSPTGRQLLKLAKEKASMYSQGLEEIFEVAGGSLTDTTLLRRFSVSDPSKVVYESKSKVYINADLSIKNAILDMAHELTHYIYRVPFNPYTKNFSLKEFVRSTVQGKGGEAQAFVTECKVYQELYSKDFQTDYHCQKIIGDNGKISYERTVDHFYRVGQKYPEFKIKMVKNGHKVGDFPKVNDYDPTFISSAYGLPYPIAAIKEYETVMERACSNDKKRLAFFKKRQSRFPASMKVLTDYQEFLLDFNQRCL